VDSKAYFDELANVVDWGYSTTEDPRRHYRGVGHIGSLRKEAAGSAIKLAMLDAWEDYNRDSDSIRPKFKDFKDTQVRDLITPDERIHAEVCGLMKNLQLYMDPETFTIKAKNGMSLEDYINNPVMVRARKDASARQPHALEGDYLLVQYSIYERAVLGGIAC